MKIRREVPNLVKMGRQYQAVPMKTSGRLSSPTTSNRHNSSPYESSDIRLWGCLRGINITRTLRKVTLMRILPILFVTSFPSLWFPLRRVEKREGARDGVAAGGSLSRYWTVRVSVLEHGTRTSWLCFRDSKWEGDGPRKWVKGGNEWVGKHVG